MANGNFVAYYRTSTTKQTLGLDAQRKIVAEYLNGGDWKLVAEFQEQESGKRSDNRPQLKAALEQCKASGSTLVIAKLDRLARNVHFISGLMESGVEFVACDMPNATRFTLHIYAAVAEEERRMISQRTKDGLAATKAKGTKLGSGNPQAGAEKAAVVRATLASEYAERLRPIVAKMMSRNVKSVRDIAAELNERGVKSPRGGEWHASSVSNLLKRLEA
jgi:DNA invertase Pin-like site-specific DNA recombinase